MHDRDQYMEIVSAAQLKILEADALWENATRSQKGFVDGMMGGLSENYERRFTSADKLQMLSEKYGIPAQSLRKLKADIEMMFSEDLSEKFSGTPA